MKIPNTEMSLTMLFVYIATSYYMWITNTMKTKFVVIRNQSIEFRFDLIIILYTFSRILFVGFLFRSIFLPKYYINVELYPSNQPQ